MQRQQPGPPVPGSCGVEGQEAGSRASTPGEGLWALLDSLVGWGQGRISSKRADPGGAERMDLGGARCPSDNGLPPSKEKHNPVPVHATMRLNTLGTAVRERSRTGKDAHHRTFSQKFRHRHH